MRLPVNNLPTKKVRIEPSELRKQSIAEEFMPVTNKDPVDRVAKELIVTKALAGKAINSVIGSIKKSMAKRGDVRLVGFGSFTKSKKSQDRSKSAERLIDQPPFQDRPQVKAEERFDGTHRAAERSKKEMILLSYRLSRAGTTRDILPHSGLRRKGHSAVLSRLWLASSIGLESIGRTPYGCVR